LALSLSKGQKASTSSARTAAVPVRPEPVEGSRGGAAPRRRLRQAQPERPRHPFAL